MVGLAATGLGLLAAKKSGYALTNKADDTARWLWQEALSDERGTRQPFSQWSGYLLVVNFWASWCPPCVEELPELQQLQQLFLNKNVQVLGIAIDKAESVAEFRAKTGVSFPLLLADASGLAWSQRLGNQAGGLPYTLIIDQAGRIQYRHAGRISLAIMQARLNELVNKD